MSSMMTEQQVFDRIVPLVSQVTGVHPDQIAMHHVLVADLGAESLDLLDLSFLIEEAFGITIEPNEFESQARKRIPGGAYEKDGFLTSEAVTELRVALPEVDPGKLVPGIRKADLPSLLTVSVFVHLIQRKLAERMAGNADA